MPLSFSECYDYPHLLDADFLLLVKMRGEQITTGLMQTPKQILDAAGNTQRRHKPKVTRIIVSSPAVFQRGQYFSPWCHETCEQRVWLFLDISSTPATGVHWVGISNFITCHKRDTGCSGEHCSLPPLTPPPSTCETSHPSLEVVLGKRRRRFPSGRLQPLASRRPYCLLAPN